MPTFYAYSLTLLHDRQGARREKIAQHLHRTLAREIPYAGVFNDRQHTIETDLYERPAYKALHKHLRIGDCVCFIALERCFTGLEDMLDKAGDLIALGIRVILADARIDSATREGRAMLKNIHWSLGFEHRRNDMIHTIANQPIV
jgi:DNA invertase Pin-like site-specific DNA recombinase